MRDTDSLRQTHELNSSMSLGALQVQDMSSWHQSFGWSSNVIRLRKKQMEKRLIEYMLYFSL